MKKALVEPFEKKHGVKVEVVTGITTEWVAKLMAAGPDNPPYDVVFGNEPAFPIPRERGFFDKRNETLAPNIKNLYPKALIGDTSLAMFWGRIGLAYRTDSGIKKPTSWKDFWDDAYAGKRATYVIGNTLGINFLFIISKIFGKDYFDIDAGVAAIKRAQPKLVDFSGTIEKQLEQKEVVIAVLHDAGSHDLQKRGMPVDWVAPSEGQPILDQVVQVTRGSKNKELAWKLIDAYLSPEVQLAFATELFWSPTNKTVKVPAGRGEEDHQRPGRRRQARALRLGAGGQAAAAVDREVEQGDALTEAPRATGTVTLTGLVKRYGATLALDGVSLAVVPGEFFTLLGPSGCGKTTTLRSVAGFVTPDAGLVAINGADVTRVPPHLRRVGMVFQHYALFPHRTVAQNVGFGLRMQRVRTGRRSRGGWTRPSPSSSSRATAGAIPASSRAASSSAWRWPARSSPARRCSCWTSRWARSTRSCATT